MAKYRRSILALCVISQCIIPSLAAPASETVSYKYDELGRLVKVSRSGTVNNGINACYTHDRADNRSNVTVTTSSDCSVPGSLASFAIDSASATEGAAVIFTVTKTPTAIGTTTIDYATAGGAAASGVDFTATSGTLTFLAADTAKTISVPTSDDAAIESAEAFTVTLSNVSSGATIGIATGTGTINDNDNAAAPSFAVNDPAGFEGEALVFTVTKTGSTSSTYSVNYGTVDGSATSTFDYYAASGTLTFSPGDTTKTVFVGTQDDVTIEGAEAFQFNLSTATGGATITDAQGVGTIEDNDFSDPCPTCLVTPPPPPQDE